MRTTLLFVLIYFFALSVLAQGVGYEKQRFIGLPIVNPNDVATDKAGNVYILQGDRITKADANGKFLNEIDLKQGRVRVSGFSLVVDHDNNIYVADGYFRNIIKYSADGNPLFVVGSTDNGLTTNSYMGRLALDKQNNLYVTSNANKEVQKFNSQGQLVRTFGSGISESGVIDNILDVGVDAQGNVYALDSKHGYNTSRTIHKFSPDGELLQQFDVNQQGPSYNPNSIVSMAVQDNGGFYTVHDFYREILQYSPDGSLIRKFSGHGPADAQLGGNNLRLSVDVSGNVYVSDDHYLNPGVKKFSATGTYLRRFGGEHTFSSPIFDRNDNLYLYVAPANAVHIYDMHGNLKRKFSTLDLSYKYPERGLLTLDPQGNIYLYESGDHHQRIQKFSEAGTLLKKYELSLPKPSGNIVFSNGFAVDRFGVMYIGDSHGGIIHQIHPDGSYIGKIGKPGTGPGEFSYPRSIVFDAMGFMYVQDYSGNRIQKFSPSGKLLMAYGDTSPNKAANFSNLSIDDYGNAFLSYYSNYSNSILRYNASGQFLEQLEVRNYGLAVTKNGHTFAALLPDKTVGFFTSSSYSAKNHITGTVFEALSDNCQLSENARPLPGVVVVAEPGPYYGLTDENGRYDIAVDAGSYTVNQLLVNEEGRLITEVCATNKVISFTGVGNTFSGPNFGNRVTLSPYLSVSVSSTRRRRCFESTTKVRYGNSGFDTAPDAKVYLQLPAEVELLSADKSHTRLADGTYVFSVGDLAAGQSGTITIEDLVTCGDESVRGLTVCTRAWITPSNNAPSAPVPTISITGRCDAQSGMIRFVVRNTGTADMPAPGHYRKYADGELASVEQYRLAAGDSMVFWVPSLGYTWRIEADQPDGNGDNTKVSVTIEGCTDGATVPSTGQVNLLPTDDEEAERSTECMLITDSYDPNDKLVTPVGRTEERYTPTNTALKYKIRFQNTGTDVAYRVVVVDTLSEHLDLSTLQVGATSHPGRLEVSGKGRPVLTWTFDNIMLPDSTADEPGSHGYILFSIKPRADLPEKTLVENSADIFFDFNSPIRTNVTQNRIFDMPPVVNEHVRIRQEDVLATPGIAEFSPAAGRFGTEVSITGQRFSLIPEDNKVYVNEKAAQVVSATATELKVLVPTGATTGALKVVTPDGGVTSSVAFQVYQPPVLSSFSPAEGMVGQMVTLTGQHLHLELVESVKLGELDCEIMSSTGTPLVVRVPAGATTGVFQVSTKGGDAVSGSNYIVWYPPSISGLSKETDIVGASITITGHNFAADKARNQVRFGNTLAQVLEATPQQLTVRVPEQAETGPIFVETPGGKTTSSSTFTLIPGPKFTAMQPASGAVGTVVEITGEHFGIMDQQDLIHFNGEPALVLEGNEGRYKVRVPRGAQTGKVTITGYGGEAHSTADFVVEELAPAEAIQVYPNPNKGQFTISLRHADFDVQSVEIIDAVGKSIHITTIDGPRPESLDIQIGSAKPGLYTLRISSGRGTINKKIMVL